MTTQTKPAHSSTITLDQLKAHYGFEYLSWDATTASSRSYSWDGDTYDYDMDGDKGWSIVHHPSIEAQVEDLSSVDIDGPDGRDAVVSAGPPDEDGEMTLYFSHDVEDMTDDQRAELLVRINEDLQPYGLQLDNDDLDDDSKDIERGEHGGEELLALWDLLPEIWEEDVEGNEDQWTPIYNFFYPLPQGNRGGDCWHRRMDNASLVRVDNEDGFGLTGCGQDMTWAICRTYLMCGYLPPYEYAIRLPRMCGAGTSARDKMVLAGCRITIEYMRDSATRALVDLAKTETWSDEYEAAFQAKQSARQEAS